MAQIDTPDPCCVPDIEFGEYRRGTESTTQLLSDYYPILSCIYCLGEDGALFLNSMCPCSYIFHKECFMEYLKKPVSIHTCPLCRININIPRRILFNDINLNKFIISKSIAANKHAKHLAMMERAVNKRDYNNWGRIIAILIFLILLFLLLFIIYVAFNSEYNSWRGG